MDIKAAKQNVKNKAWEIKERARWKLRDSVEWLQKNREGVALGLVILGGVGKATKEGIRYHEKLMEKKHREREVYDCSNRGYVELKRKLNNKDHERINKLRKEKVLRYTEALQELKLTK